MKTVLTGLAAFVGGALVSWANYLLLRRVLQAKGEAGLGPASMVRTVLSAAYLVILYFIGKRTGFGAALLVGGALGLTAMLLFFTLRLTGGMKGQRKE